MLGFLKRKKQKNSKCKTDYCYCKSKYNIPEDFTCSDKSGALYAINFIDHCFQISFKNGKTFWFKGDDIIFKYPKKKTVDYELYIKTVELKKKGIV